MERMYSMIHLKVFSVLVAVGLVFSLVSVSPLGHRVIGQSGWTAPAQAKAMKNPLKADAASLKKGQDLYKANCATCHGNTGEGDGPMAKKLKTKPASIKTAIKGQTDGELFWKISEGKPPMPPFKSSLKEADRWAIVNYIRSL